MEKTEMLLNLWIENKQRNKKTLPWWLRWSRLSLPMQETQVWSLSQEDPLEKGMANHSSILAWRIPWTEEPGGVQSAFEALGGLPTPWGPCLDHHNPGKWRCEPRCLPWKVHRKYSYLWRSIFKITVHLTYYFPPHFNVHLFRPVH